MISDLNFFFLFLNFKLFVNFFQLLTPSLTELCELVLYGKTLPLFLSDILKHFDFLTLIFLTLIFWLWFFWLWFFWLWFFRLQLLKFRFWFSSSMIIQYGYYYGSFNTLILLLRLLTWWSLWTLRKYLNIFWLWKCLDFGTSTFEISFGIFFFNDHSWVLLYYGSFNTLILLLLLLTRWSLWTLRKCLKIL